MSVPSDVTARPRNRRMASGAQHSFPLSASTSTSLLDVSPGPSERASRSTSPYPSQPPTRDNSGTRAASAMALFGSGRNSPVNNALNKASGIFDVSWGAVSGFASNLLLGETTQTGPPGSRTRSVGAKPRAQKAQLPTSWGANPQGSTGKDGQTRARLNAGDIGTGAMAEREARLRTLKTRSILESHDGVNGGLDITGRFKRRTSDEDLRSSNQRSREDTPWGEPEQQEEALVYVHHVQLRDTYAGIILRYQCREDAFKKANGLWNQNHIATRKFVYIPVDACEVRGRPCEGPNYTNNGAVDLLASTPEASAEASTLEGAIEAAKHTEVDYFGLSQPNGKASQKPDDQPWEHVRWVRIDGLDKPVEIGRVSRREIGYFPPRRKKAIFSASQSTLNTPRQSVDLTAESATSAPRPSVEFVGSPTSTASRRRGDSLLSNRPPLSSITSSAGTRRSRLNSISTIEDPRPAWMMRPGGVGTLGRNVRAPGPGNDALNAWARKHFSNLTIDDLPSMSVIGAETAHFGFSKGGEPAEIAQGGDGMQSLQEGVAIDSGGISLDKAAIAVESWLRGAWQKGAAGTPILGPRRNTASSAGDLIELEVASDDGRIGGASLLMQDPMLGLPSAGPSSRSGWLGNVIGSSGSSGWAPTAGAEGRMGMRGRGTGLGGTIKDKKKD